MAAADELLARATAGDVEAFSSLLAELGGELRATIERQIESRWQNLVFADDVMQVTYIEAFLRVRSFVPTHGINGFRAWIRRVAENNLRDAIREFGRAKEPPRGRRVEPPAGADSWYDGLRATTTTPSRAAARAENAHVVDSLVRQLPPDYERVLRMVDLGGRTIAQAAAEMKRSEGAVKMLLQRARDRLREIAGSESRFFSDA